jgi:hypothetical protein
MLTTFPMNFRLARALLMSACLVGFPSRAPAPLVYEQGEGWVYRPSAGSPVVPPELVLHQQAVPYNLETVYWPLDSTNTPFLKEPELSKQGVLRGWLRFGKKDTNNAIALVWDQPKRRLYLDQNRNLDLTDDLAGVFSSTNKGVQQTFTNVTVLMRTAAGLHPSILGLRLWSDGAARQMHAQLDSRSLWEAKLGLSGEEWQVAILDDPFGPEGPAFAKFMVLRPWTARTNRLYLRDLTSGIVGFPDQLFWLGQAFHLQRRFETQDGVPLCKLEFTPQRPPMTEVKLSGESFYYAVLRATNGYTAVLGQSPGTLNVPQGRYTATAVWLKKGAAEAYRLSNEPLIINATAPTNLVLGGPLTNSVTLTRQGRKLNMNYQLLGADGGWYRFVQQDRSKPPDFVVYRGGKKVHSGVFAFG